MAHIQNGPHIFVANHKKALDAFVIGSALPFKTIIKLLPMAFILHNGFYDSPLRPLVWIIGCYPARDANGKHALFGVNASIEHVRHGYSMCIFPEGTRVKNHRGPAKSGVIRIHAALPDTPFILCRITYHKGLKNILCCRWRTVRYTLVKKPLYTHPEKVMDDVFAL